MDRFRFNELATGTIEGDLVDEDGAAVPGASLTAAELTLFDLDTCAPGTSPATGIVNGRDGQNALGVNDVEIDSDGHWIWTLQPEDNVIVTPRRQVERHRAMLVFAWADGKVTYECEIEVVNLRKAS